MITPASPLSDYKDPPIVEVIFAVAVDPLPVSIMDLSAFALESFGAKLPVRQEQPPIRMARETFDEPIPRLGPTLELLAGQPPLRLWLQSADRTRLLQLQRDWMACNWQKADGTSPYPRYGGVEEFFLGSFDAVADFALRGANTDLKPRQCELSYVNQILPGPLWESHGQIANVVRLAGEVREFLPAPEDAQLLFRYRIAHGGRDIGRLYVQARPGLRPTDMTPLIRLDLIARGTPLDETREGMLEFFRLAHEWIVRGFAAVTTEEAQDTLWGRTQ